MLLNIRVMGMYVEGDCISAQELLLAFVCQFEKSEYCSVVDRDSHACVGDAATPTHSSLPSLLLFLSFVSLQIHCSLTSTHFSLNR